MNPVLQYFRSELVTQFKSVGPISVFLIIFVSAARRRLVNDFWQTLFGMICAAFGLTLFLFGLKGSIMPLAEKIGDLLNQKFHLSVVLFISFIFGVLVTLAEPAVSALRPLGAEVDRFRAPYLYYIVNDGIDLLLLAIGIGVGIAAVVGTARFVYRWKFKPIVVASASFCVLTSGIIYMFVEDLRPTISLAWDAGAVTTGPVTVPILLALGKGAVSNSALTKNPRILRRRPMQGFGLVTLASLYPIICVHIYSVIVYFTVSEESIKSGEVKTQDSAADRPPVRELITAIRSIAPLSVVLIGVLKLLLRAGLPHVSMQSIMRENATQAPAYGDPHLVPNLEEASAGEGCVELSRLSTQGLDVESQSERAASPLATDGDAVHGDFDHEEEPMVRSDVEPSAMASHGDNVKFQDESDSSTTTEDGDAVDISDVEPSAMRTHIHDVQLQDESDSSATTEDGDIFQSETITSPLSESGYAEPGNSENNNETSDKATSSIFLWALLSSQIGLILFNIGLHYGFASLGSQVGDLLPALYKRVDGDPDSPLLSAVPGSVVAYAFIFCLAILATRAEPGLKVLSEQVKSLTEGIMKRKHTVYSVALGVAIGMMAGSSRLQFSLDIFPYLSIMYVIALYLTLFAPRTVVKVAWDSAGVTTGPVTVPFVLSIGLAYAKALSLQAGFGILACSSVGPIITVLLVGIFRSCASSK